MPCCSGNVQRPETNSSCILKQQVPTQQFSQVQSWLLCARGFFSLQQWEERPRGHTLGIVKSIHGDRDLPWEHFPKERSRFQPPTRTLTPLWNLHTGGSAGSVWCFCFPVSQDAETAGARLERRQASLLLHKHLLGSLPGLQTRERARLNV